MRGLNGPHPGAQLPWTVIMVVLNVALRVESEQIVHALIGRARHHAALERQIVADAHRKADAHGNRLAKVVAATHIAAAAIGKPHG